VTLGRATRAVGVERAPEQAGRPSPAGIGPAGARAREKAATDLAWTPSGSAPPSAEAASGRPGRSSSVGRRSSGRTSPPHRAPELRSAPRPETRPRQAPGGP
jgi:hypothetical protein